MSFCRTAMRILLTAALLGTGVSTMALAADPAQPSAPIVKSFGTWNTSCQEQKIDGKTIKNCHAFVDVRIGEKKDRLLYLGIGYVPGKTDGSMFLLAITPLGTLLPVGIQFAVDDKELVKAGFAVCVPLGCQTDIALTPEQIKTIRTGSLMGIEFRLAAQGPVKIPVKLDGAGKALDSLPKPK
ncbi:MAG: invasion associated locus B family protein [Parvibaculaceae bacterium]|nr:invasion associated locus B family protein [Parvibaculaceae bacterium]